MDQPLSDSARQYCASFLYGHVQEREKFLAVPGNDVHTRHKFGPWADASVDTRNPPEFRVCACGYTEWRDR